jgi:CheY-like chemotaxis protein
MNVTLQRGAELVRQILTFARGLDGRRGPVQLCALMSELTWLFRHTFPRSVTIQTSVPESLWRINADPTQIHQVLTNLCVNARDAMPGGGRLRIAAENRHVNEQEALRIGELAPGPYVVLEVEDTGTGIPKDLLSRIFEPFFTTKEASKGTGLGLSTASAIIRSHGGRIVVESELGKGTRFTIYFPALETPEDEPAEPGRRELQGGKGELVLVVDDEAALLHIARLTLTAAGYQVLTAQHGGEALALYAQRRQEIRAVLTDLMMPVMDGAATIWALQGLNPDVRVIVFSGLLNGAEIAESLGPGVKAYLAKPYTAEMLLTTLRSVLDLPKDGRKGLSGRS